MNSQDGWVNFADYLELNRDASQRQLQGALDSRKGDAEQIRANADRNYARAGLAGFEGNAVDYGQGGEQQKLTMQYGDFVEGLSDPSRLEAFFAKQAGGGNSMLDAGLASVAGAGQIQEAQKGLEKLRNYVTEREVDTETRRQGGEDMRARADQQAQDWRDRNAGILSGQASAAAAAEAERKRKANALAWLDNKQGATNPFKPDGSNREEVDRWGRERADPRDPYGRRFADPRNSPAPNKWDAPGVGLSPPGSSFISRLPSWAKPKGF